ncbi:hypothetical protein NG793_27365 [Laspinema sp. C5]|nr:hypothetical protein [Laspinema sp. D3c]
MSLWAIVMGTKRYGAKIFLAIAEAGNKSLETQYNEKRCIVCKAQKP